MFSTKGYDQTSFEHANEGRGPGVGHEIEILEDRLQARTARLAAGAEAVCIFVNDVAALSWS